MAIDNLDDVLELAERADLTPKGRKPDLMAPINLPGHPHPKNTIKTSVHPDSPLANFFRRVREANQPAHPPLTASMEISDNAPEVGSIPTEAAEFTAPSDLSDLTAASALLTSVNTLIAEAGHEGSFSSITELSKFASEPEMLPALMHTLQKGAKEFKAYFEEKPEKAINGSHADTPWLTLAEHTEAENRVAAFNEQFAEDVTTNLEDLDIHSIQLAAIQNTLDRLALNKQDTMEPPYQLRPENIPQTVSFKQKLSNAFASVSKTISSFVAGLKPQPWENPHIPDHVGAASFYSSQSEVEAEPEETLQTAKVIDLAKHRRAKTATAIKALRSGAAAAAIAAVAFVNPLSDGTNKIPLSEMAGDIPAAITAEAETPVPMTQTVAIETAFIEPAVESAPHALILPSEVEVPSFVSTGQTERFLGLTDPSLAAKLPEISDPRTKETAILLGGTPPLTNPPKITLPQDIILPTVSVIKTAAISNTSETKIVESLATTQTKPAPIETGATPLVSQEEIDAAMIVQAERLQSALGNRADGQQFLRSLELTESSFIRGAVSPKGALGPLQVMPATAPEAAAEAGVPFDENLYKNPTSDRGYAYAILIGKAYLAARVEQFGDLAAALAGYNWGPGNVAKYTDRVGSPADGTISQVAWLAGTPSETQGHVRKTFENAGLTLSNTAPNRVASTPVPRENPRRAFAANTAPLTTTSTVALASATNPQPTARQTGLYDRANHVRANRTVTQAYITKPLATPIEPYTSGSATVYATTLGGGIDYGTPATNGGSLLVPASFNAPATGIATHSPIENGQFYKGPDGNVYQQVNLDL